MARLKILLLMALAAGLAGPAPADILIDDFTAGDVQLDDTGVDFT